MGRPRCLLAAAVLGAGSLLAQEPLRPVEHPVPRDSALPGNAALTLFERSRNTFNWTGGLALDTTAGGTRIHLRHLYGSNIILLESPGGQRVKSDQSSLAFMVTRPVIPALDLRTDFSSRVYTDERAVGLSSVSTHVLAGGVAFSPSPFLSLTPMAGYRWDVQGSRGDRGPRYALDGRLRDLLLDGYSVAGDLRLEEDRLAPRRLGTRGIQAGVQKSFEGGTRDSLSLAMFRTQREFYGTTDSSGVESRVERVLSFANLLDYEMDSYTLASLFVGLSSRGLQRDTRSAGVPLSAPAFGAATDEFRLETFVQLSHERDGGILGFVRLLYAERVENHEARPPEGSSGAPGTMFTERNEQEGTKNNSARRTVLAGKVSFPVGASDTLRCAASGSILRYDTPSRANTEDRDEQLFAVTVSSSHRLGRTLQLTLELDGTMSHTVYLLKERSAGNNRNRVLRLSPRTVYRPSADFGTVNGFEVLANYTVYDFEEQTALVRSFSYRQFAWYDSTTLELTRRIGLDFLGSLKFYERGQLNWGAFTERTENAFVDRLLSCQLRWSPAAGTVFAVGYRSFVQRRYSYGGGERTLDVALQSVGPTCMILRDAGPRGRVSLLGWYERWSQNAGTARSLANLSLNVQFNF